MNTGEVKDYRHNLCPGRKATNELKIKRYNSRKFSEEK